MRAGAATGIAWPIRYINWRHAGLALLLLTMWALLPALFYDLPSPAQVQARFQSSEAELLDRHGSLLASRRVDLSIRRQHWVVLPHISPALQAAVLAAEDRRFYGHGGIDWAALLSALLDTATGEPRGGSTLTMQLAGLVSRDLQAHDGRRSPLQKIRQLVYAKRLEAHWQKAQILEAYLNLATFRGELSGIGAASAGLFGKSADGLDEREAALLASLLRAPNAGKEIVAERVCNLAAQGARPQPCLGLRAFTLATLAAPNREGAGPDEAAELFSSLRPAAGSRLTSTLDAPLQRFVRRQLAEQLGSLQGRNVRDAAAVVLDNRTGEVLAWVGHAGPGASARFVDGVTAPRQAGSTLKPFLYSLALERRLLTPASLLDDTPVKLTTPGGEYMPQNYDHVFRGPVSVRLALASSLNIPAVRTLLLVGLDEFHTRLRELGLDLPLPAAHYGYGLALGSAEVRLIDLANAYRTLANAGLSSPWHITPGNSLAQQVISPAASWLAADIIADRAARAPAFGLDNALATAGWAAVKTGTSKDMRDNWAVGFTDRYTVGVWVGNADGEAMWDVSGVSGAAPAWHAIVAYLHGSQPSRPPLPPAGISRQAVRFQPPLEAPRQEAFLVGTELSVVELAGNSQQVRIVYPNDGTILAYDPDIPAAHQRILFRADSGAALSWQLDGKVLGSAAQTYFWVPQAGQHRLTVVDRTGQVQASTRFNVRGRLAEPEKHQPG